MRILTKNPEDQDRLIMIESDEVSSYPNSIYIDTPYRTITVDIPQGSAPQLFSQLLVSGFLDLSTCRTVAIRKPLPNNPRY